YRERFRTKRSVTRMVTQLHHVNVTVPAELEAPTKEFYGSVLGLQQVPKPPGSRQSGAWYQIGATQLHLSVEDEVGGSQSSRHVCFTVDDLAATEKRFRDAGVTKTFLGGRQIVNREAHVARTLRATHFVLD